MKNFVWKSMWMALAVFVMEAAGGQVDPDRAVNDALEWMAGNPVMSQAGATVDSVQSFPEGAAYSVYVVSLSPTGYLILNSDDRLPLLVSFSAKSSVDLSEDPQNALRSMLLDYCENTAKELARMPENPVRTSSFLPPGDPELFGPYLETSWSQNDPYNLLCPSVSGALNGYEGRAPAGCVPVVYAQIMNFHRWPLRGNGSRLYMDNEGSVNGWHQADFSDAYDWGSLQASHASSDSQVVQDAIAELMFELGVAAGANYEATSTSASINTLGDRLDYFYFESVEKHSSLSDLVVAVEDELRAGFPCVVAIPGHAVVADGLMVDGGVTTYHINYGWGGVNNGWYTSTGIPGGTLQYGITAIRPQLMAFPETNALFAESSGSTELHWILPKRRETEVSQLEIVRYNEVSTVWEPFAVDPTLASRRFSDETTLWSPCDDLSGFDVYSSSPVKQWAVTSVDGHDGCFFIQPDGYGGADHMTSVSTITPASSTRLLLNAKYTLYADPFSVSVSTDGSSFTEIWSAVGSMDWGDIAIDLSDYAGQAIYIRLQYTSGSYYPDVGGVWVDSISIQTVTHPELEGQPVHYSTLTGLPVGTNVLAAVLTDTDGTVHERGPSFVLVVTESGDANDIDSDGLPDDWEDLYFGGEGVADSTAIASNGVNTVLEAYVAGLDPTDPEALFTASVDHNTGNGVQWNAVSGRVYTVYATTNLAEGFQPVATNICWPQSSWTDTVDRAGCFYKVEVQLQE